MGATAIAQSQAGAAKNHAMSLGGALSFKAFSVTMSSSYATGGDDCDLDQFFESAVFGAIPAPSGGYVFEYDISAKKLKAYHVDMDAQADSPLVEVDATTDLDAVTVQILAWGK